MACIASTFTGSVAALKASKVQVRRATRVRAKSGATARTFFREAIENASDANARARVERDARVEHDARASRASRRVRAFSAVARVSFPDGLSVRANAGTGWLRNPARPRWHAKSRLRDATSGD